MPVSDRPPRRAPDTTAAGCYSRTVGFLDLQRLFVWPRFAVRAEPGAGDDVPGLERLWRETPAGRVEAWLLPAEGATAAAGTPAPLVIFAHGNGELVDHWPAALAPYRALGLHVLLPEFRGYGRSGGEPSERDITDDFVAWHDLVSSRVEVDAARIVLHGRSIGGGVACALAARRRPAALVLQSTFTCLGDVTRRFLLPRAFVLDQLDNLAVLRALDAPVLLVHGRTDALIPPAQAEALAAAARRARLVWFDGGHNDPPPAASYWKSVGEFLEEAGILRAVSGT